ncbi:hypothetical protein [Catellatospora chokoriensis]|uniref:Uncharacterized protein n=1 Tax=Catellatospora chokoriensis TaxID=310353 RepID=A0A8J3JPT7_9ACTN|nr:hypothetical protein [Catellatospora chokoriensis]GIF88862.1 hypothetical protein Cch02nite_23060 [Catellatospora chokoriensis]
MAPPRSDIEYTEPFRKAFEQIRTGLDRAVEEFNKIVEQVKDWAWLLGGAALWWIKNNLDAVREGLQKIMDRARYAFDHELPVLSLITTSFTWVDQVKGPVSELSFTTTEPRDQNLAKWTGDTAASYRDKAAKQKAAVDETVAKAEFISQWLFKIAQANVDYAVELAKVVTGLVGKLIQAGVAATTVIDIPWAIDTLAESIGDLIEDGLNNLLTVGGRFVAALGDVRDLATQVGDHSKLPGGRWPEAVRG